MQLPSTTPTIGEARTREPGRGYGLVLFASILLLVIGCFNLIYGIAAIAQSHVFTAHAHYVFGDLRSWGWITLIFGCLQLLIAPPLLTALPLPWMMGNRLFSWKASATPLSRHDRVPSAT